MSSEAVTQRYLEEDDKEPIDPRVTQAWEPDAAITQRFDEPPARAAKPQPALLAGRYRVLHGPLGQHSGEADVFHCRDEDGGAEVVVKLYRYKAQPKSAVIEQLQGLSHPAIIHLQRYGHWQERFYEVMDYCAGGVMSDHMPYSEERLRACLPALLSGLHYCHEQGIIHRDIKPNNLFLRAADSTQPLLGDFGISSYIDTHPLDVRVTQSAASLTLDYAAPELIDGHEVSAKTDYYALGLSLIHLLLGRSPYYGMSNNDILVAHLRGRLHLPENVSPGFRALLRGLTHPNPEQRWGHEQLSRWLRGDSVPPPRDDPWQDNNAKPYPGYPEARTPRQLAAALERFDALTHLYRGDIRRWVFDNFSHEMAQTLEKIAAQYQNGDARTQPTALAKLRFALHPYDALHIGKHRITRLADLLELLKTRDASLRRQLEEALWEEQIETWVQAGQQAGNRSLELAEKIAALRERLRYTRFEGVALFALFYTLNPQQTLALGKGLSIRHPGQLQQAFRKNRKQAGLALRQLLYSKRLEEWLRAAEFDGWEEDVVFLENVRERYLDKRDVGTYMARCRFQPDLPFPLAGKLAKTPQQLARLIDRNRETWQAARRLLEQEWLRAWLVGGGRLHSATDFDHAMLMVDKSWDSKLEAIVQMLDPSLPPPQLAVEPPSLLFNTVSAQRPREKTLRIRNAGRGHLSGHIELEQSGSGIELEHFNIEGATEIRVRLNPLGCQPGYSYENALYIRSNGGNLAIPIRFQVRREREQKSWWQRLLKI